MKKILVHLKNIRSAVWRFLIEGNLLVVALVTLGIAVASAFGAVYLSELLAPTSAQVIIGWTVIVLAASVIPFIAGLELGKKLK